jgi:hypothetical protein
MVQEDMRPWQAGLAVLLVTAAAAAQGTERVTLADGTVMQGELVEKVPGNHITLKLATGEIRTIAWSALAPQEQAPPPPPNVSVQVGAPVAPQTTTPTGPTTHVAMDADRPGVTLLRVTGLGVVQAASAYGTAYGSFMSYQPVCVAPCQADVEAGAMYRIGGDGVTPTSTFSLPPPAPGRPLVLHVSAGSAGARFGGLWLTIGGITLAATGGVLAGLFAAIGNEPGMNTNGWIVGGLVTAGVGVVMTAFGIWMIAESGTSVVTDQGIPIAKGHPAGPRITPAGLVF